MGHDLRLLTPEEAGEYRQQLDAYHPSGQVVVDFARSKFGVIAGPTGAGKDTLRNALIQAYPEAYRPVLSTTTRPPRPGEQEGGVYHFRSFSEFDRGLDEQRFLQAEVVHGQQISGLDFDDIARLDGEHFGLSILIVQTEQKLRRLNPDLKTVFIVPPTYDELQRRLTADRSMDENELRRRLQAAEAELTIAQRDEHYCLLVNDRLEQAVTAAHSFFFKGDIDGEQTAQAHQTIAELLNMLRTYHA